MTLSAQSITDPKFWQQPLAERMAQFAVLREQRPFLPVSYRDVVVQPDEDVRFFAVTRYHEVVEISRRPLDFCSGQGSTLIADLPAEVREVLVSIIAMDDPRHARQRGIVARAFTPRRLAGLLDSVGRICAEVIDSMCEAGEVDLVEAVSVPFPLRIICDMMGIPPGEFPTVVRASNVMLSAGDPELVGTSNPAEIGLAMMSARRELSGLMKELAEARRRHPTDDLTSALVYNDVGEDMLSPAELAGFFVLLVVAGNETTRNAISHGLWLLADHPEQRARWQADIESSTPAAVEEIVRVASSVTYMRRTVTRNLTLSDQHFKEGDKVVMFYGAANRDPRAFPDPETFDIHRNPNAHVGFGGPGPHFCLGAHLARRELNVMFRQLLNRLPDIELAGDPVRLQAPGIPLIHGIKHLPVRFTPTAPVGAQVERRI
jgi:cytochrome P450